MQPSEPLLQASQGTRYRLRRRGIDGAGEIVDLPQPAHADPQPMQPDHRGALARPAVGGHESLVPPRPVLREPAEDRPRRDRPDRSGEERGHLVEEAPIGLRAEQRPQQLATGPRIVPQPAPVALEPLLVATSVGERLHAPEEVDRDVSVSDLTDQPGEPAQASIERREPVALRPRDEFTPDGEPRPQVAEIAMEVVEASRGRLGTLDHRFGALRRRTYQALELAAQPLEPSCLRVAHRYEEWQTRRSPRRL